LPFTAFGHSDTGRQRASNEDHFLCLVIGESPEIAHVVAVADGMGGHAGGKVASDLAITALETTVNGATGPTARSGAARLLRRAFESANRDILKHAAEDRGLTDMGTTMVAAVVSDAAVTLANLGDSRAYLVRQGIIGQLSVDHSWKEEARRHDLSMQEIATSPFRETITRSLGVDTAVDVDIFDFVPRTGDQMLLCSDGLHDLLSDLEILETMAVEEPLERIGRRLVDMANEAGGHDNSTCVLVRYDGPGAGASTGAADA
jgi:protein phosphatase